MTKESKMKTTKFFGGMILIMLLCLAGSTYGYIDPLAGGNDVVGITEPSDHPWGGEGGSGTGGGGGDLLIVIIGTPVPVYNFIQLIPIFNDTKDIRATRNAVSITKKSKITRVSTSPTIIRSTIIRGN
jgi:hypothetical protein